MIDTDLSFGGQIAPPSFQSLYLRLKFGDTQLASATGFLVQTEMGVGLVTARHNLTGRHHETKACLHAQGGVPDAVEIFHNGLPHEPSVLKREAVLNAQGAPSWIEHSELRHQCDVALLPLRNLSSAVLAPYSREQTYPDISVKVAELVSVIGFPMGQTAGAMYAIWCTGYVASEPTQDHEGQPKFLVDCRTRQGQSGSPVIAYRNGPFRSSTGAMVFYDGPVLRPLGVYTGRIHPDADIGVVWKWSVVEDLMRQADERFTNATRAGSALFGGAQNIEVRVRSQSIEAYKNVHVHHADDDSNNGDDKA